MGDSNLKDDTNKSDNNKGWGKSYLKSDTNESIWGKPVTNVTWKKSTTETSSQGDSSGKKETTSNLNNDKPTRVKIDNSNNNKTTTITINEETIENNTPLKNNCTKTPSTYPSSYALSNSLSDSDVPSSTVPQKVIARGEYT